MTNQIEYFCNLFEAYYETDCIERVQLRNEIEPIVLTGEQILESGIADFTERYNEYEADKEELESEIEGLKQRYEKPRENYAKWNKAYIKLKGLYQKLRNENVSSKNNKLAKIEKIIQRKQGPIIDEIREAIK